MYVELGACQHHVFMDWLLVDDERWRDIYVALNGAGVESMQARWNEMFGEKKEEEIVEEVKVKKPRRKAAKAKPPAKKTVKPTKKTPVPKKPAAKRTAVKKSR